jgi:hypothetical protein
MGIMMGISPKNPHVLLKYLVGLHNHLQNQVMLFKPNKIDEVHVQAQYLENIGDNKEYPSGSNHKENQDASKEGKKKQKGNPRR